MPIFNTQYMVDFGHTLDIEKFPDILSLIYDGVAESPYGNVPFDQEAFESTLQEYFIGRDSDKISLILWCDNEPVGILVAVCTNNHLFFNVERCGYELFWYVKPEHRKYNWSMQMLDMFEHWAKYRGCRRVVMGHFEKYHLGKLYQRRGYQPFEYSYNKDLT